MSRNVADKVVMLPLLLGIFGSQFFFANGFLFGGGSTRRDCYITPWTNWKNCRPLPDGTSVETRIRYVTPASGGGKACSPNLQTKETRPCGQSPGEESKVATNVLLTAVASLTSPFASSKGTLSSGATNLPREKNSKGEYCDVIKTPAGQVLASGNCSPHKSRKRRSVDEEETLASFLKRFRRQILEQFSDIVLLMDKSRSISSSSNMQVIKEVAASIVHVICQAIDLSSDRTRVAVASFDTGFHRHIEMNRFAREDQKPALEAAIKGLKISPNGGTALNAAVDKARSNILHDKSKGSRYKDPRVRQMTFVISDGCGNGNDNLTPEIVRDRYKAEGSCIVSVFIGNDKNCKDHMQAFDTKCTCFQQFFYSSFADAKKNLVDEINKIPAGFCAAPTWNDLLLKC
ncbi:unnamed protein product [Clavelina lepadiformis]|uniref:VWFA domain-containing protein n=1 Tax=Clavelina lepadiformis TaxID=159417 RepID=A0ABP0H0F3_CLALP